MSARTTTVLIFPRSFDAVFVTDISSAIFTATTTKNYMYLGFLSTFVSRRAVTGGSEVKADWRDTFESQAKL